MPVRFAPSPPSWREQKQEQLRQQQLYAQWGGHPNPHQSWGQPARLPAGYPSNHYYSSPPPPYTWGTSPQWHTSSPFSPLSPLPTKSAHKYHSPLHRNRSFSCDPTIGYDFAYPPNYAQPIFALPHYSVTSFETPYYFTRAGYFPWCFSLPKSKYPLTIRDLHMVLWQPVQRDEFHTLSSHRQASVAKAFQRRCRRIDGRERGHEYMKGLKRVDFLAGRTRYAGVKFYEETGMTVIWEFLLA